MVVWGRVSRNSADNALGTEAQALLLQVDAAKRDSAASSASSWGWTEIIPGGQNHQERAIIGFAPISESIELGQERLSPIESSHSVVPNDSTASREVTVGFGRCGRHFTGVSGGLGTIEPPTVASFLLSSVALPSRRRRDD